MFGLSGGRRDCFKWVLEILFVGIVWRLGPVGGLRLCLLGAAFSLLVWLFGGGWIEGLMEGRGLGYRGLAHLPLKASFRWALVFPRVRRGAGFIRIVRSWLRGAGTLLG